MKKTLLLTLACVFTLLMAGCDPFMRPKGTWYCEELGMTIHFTDEDIFEGTVVIDGVTKALICELYWRGSLDIYYKPDDYPIEDGFIVSYYGKVYYMSLRDYHEYGLIDSSEITYLYEGNLKYINGDLGGTQNGGRGVIFYAEEKNDEKLAKTEEYKFERVYAEGEKRDLIKIPLRNMIIDVLLVLISVLIGAFPVIIAVVIIIIVIIRNRKLRKKK